MVDSVGGMSAAGIAGNLLYSAIGFVAFAYGKKTNHFRIMILGGVLMGFPYLVSDTTMMWVIGAALTAGLFFIWE